MKLCSTNNKAKTVDFEQAVFQSLPPDNGLYIPSVIPRLSHEFIAGISSCSFPAIAYEIAHTLLQGAVGEKALKNIVEETVNFPAPIVQLDDRQFVLELFHGPSMAFKDFGARFMSRVMAWFLQKEKRKLNILTATSGDTGGAVALGFYEVPNIEVTILYPSGKVSPVQEKQLTTPGKNITAVEVNGVFDDCQRLVKQAFLDKALNEKLNLASANSINMARLIPQTFYYFNAYAQLRKTGDDRDVVFSVPSGNFGNLTAGLIAQRMGLPVKRFIASTNINDEVPRYLQSGIFEPQVSKHTLSNAMDVGNPSNFARLLDLFDHDVNAMKQMVSGYRFTDEETLQAIEEIFRQKHYIACPHTAVACLGLKQYQVDNPGMDHAGVFLSTAHACKFPDVYKDEIKALLSCPPQAASFANSTKKAMLMENDFEAFKEILLSGKSA